MRLAINTLHEQLSALDAALCDHNNTMLKLCARTIGEVDALRLFRSSLPLHKALAEVRNSVRELDVTLFPYEIE